MARDEYVVRGSSVAGFSGHNVDLERPPRVSFAIPTFNSERTLDRCLRSIRAQEYPDIEIVIVDQYSGDRTVDIARKYTDKVFFQGGPLGSARQASIEHSTGPIVALFDSDIIIPHPRWLANAVRYFNCSDRVSTVWPRNVAPPGASLTARLYFNLWDLIMADRMEKKRGLVGGGNALFLRRCLDDIGGVSRELHWGEDFDWARRLRGKGYQVVFLHDPLYHDTMGSLVQFARKQFVGARAFAPARFGLMSLAPREVLYEQVILGGRGFLTGLIGRRDPCWLLYPLFLAIRIVAYTYASLAGLARQGQPTKRD